MKKMKDIWVNNIQLETFLFIRPASSLYHFFLNIVFVLSLPGLACIQNFYNLSHILTTSSVNNLPFRDFSSGFFPFWLFILLWCRWTSRSVRGLSCVMKIHGWQLFVFLSSWERLRLEDWRGCDWLRPIFPFSGKVAVNGKNGRLVFLAEGRRELRILRLWGERFVPYTRCPSAYWGLFSQNVPFKHFPWASVNKMASLGGRRESLTWPNIFIFCPFPT